ncbi:MAG: aminoacyl-tRNA hydrolase [Erysipelotrichaceae bacterium]|nr:aminoacyl-tRNA hydrolase [Erysipelotrichaceae bacterium]
MKLIVGLGNPGKKYEGTRHNMGFMVADAFADIAKIDVDKEIFNGLLGRGKIADEDIFIFKPTTFMNLSGTAVQQVVHYFKIDVADIIVIFDDMALQPGEIRLRLSGSSGGHKGIQNIIENLGTDQIKRIRIGIGEPPVDGAIDFVLGKPVDEEKELINGAIQKGVEALKEALKFSFNRAMSKYN